MGQAKMARPYNRIRKAQQPEIQQVEQQEVETPQADIIIPEGWSKGQHLNVLNLGGEYILTVWPEEYSPEREDRAIRFTNSAQCQDFISDWYARQHHDPRAV